MAKNTLIFLLIAFLGSFCEVKVQNEPLTTIYMLRHAEKAGQPTDDPPLNDLGKQRAQKLMYLLGEIEFQTIYSSDYLRTKNTVKPLAEAKSLTTEIYDAHDKSFIQKALSQNTGGNYLIVGHSNTIPALVNYLTGEDAYGQLEESEYDKLFVVTLAGIGEAKVQVLRF